MRTFNPFASIGFGDDFLGGGGIGGLGSGAALGEPGYSGRTADESRPGWTPNPRAFDPFNKYPAGDPHTGGQYMEPYTCGQHMEPFTGRGGTGTASGLLALAIGDSATLPDDTDTDFPIDPFAETASVTGGLVKVGSTYIDGILYDQYSDGVPGSRWIAIPAETSTNLPADGVVQLPEITITGAPPTPAPLAPPPTSSSPGPPPSAPPESPILPPLAPPTIGLGTSTIPPAGRPQPSTASLTEKILYRDLKESGYSAAALNRLNKHYEEQFPLSGGNLRELLLKRSAAFATAFGGQTRQVDYLSVGVVNPIPIGNAALGLLDLAGATIAGGSWSETAENLVKGILEGGVLGAAFGILGGSSAASGAAGTRGTLAPELESALPRETSSTGASALPEGRPTFGNIVGPQEGELAGVLQQEGTIHYLGGRIHNLEGSTTPLTGKYDFVIKDGQILVGKGHGFLADGERVTWAGELNFANDGSGVLESWSNVSGHIRAYAGFSGNVRIPPFINVPFVKPLYFPAQSGLPQLPVIQ
jgi:hypothetical protein